MFRWLSNIINFFFMTFYSLYVRFTRKKPKITRSLLGKTALVTGGSRGIGYEIALDLASRGCRVFITSRNPAEKQRLQIIEKTHNTNVYCERLDLTSLTSVADFARDFAQNVDTLDILVNNAGIIECDGNPTEDGFNPVMLTNYFGPFLLTHLLLELLKKSAQGRIFFMTSVMAFFADLDPHNLNKINSCNYPNSKMAVMMASDYFAAILKDTKVTSNAYHPGVVKTSILDQPNVKQHGVVMALFYGFVKFSDFFVGRDTWDVAESVTFYVSSKDFDSASGKFFFEDREACRRPKMTTDVKFVQDCLRATGDILKIPVSPEKLSANLESATSK